MTKPDISGLLVIDKPRGITSHDVVAAVRGALHMKRVGHAGTLDPMATGVLVVGFGNATRLLNYIVDHDKTYLATIRLGQRTDTDDADGELLPMERIATTFPSRRTVEKTIAERFTGRIEQVPNSYSAIKINGQRAYDLAREGKDVDLKARPVTISEFHVSAVRYGYASSARAGAPLAVAADISPDEAWKAGTAEPGMQPVMEIDVRVACSAGTYIRALGRDLGEELGLGGHLTMLRRIRVGRFSVDAPNVMTAHAESKTFTNRDGVEVTRNRAVLDDADHAADHALDLVASAAVSMDMLPVSGREATDLRFGRRIARDIRGTMAAYVPETNDLVAIVERAKKGEAKPVAVFN
ncbi:tRNA pseudouridine(55) synthase TruB [Bifidobacterium ruminantium]|uniref:tRNA pseudouridine synthase B n=1 Tax=Bifidobacterium ruminantium TaxID=78346 RepID=A0A087CWF8_BIFRU|nr:tRNA pseudouridine(55) synthase TruB [Bifidobacterium ruminantium]KFI87608.1 tRNA pseudouridine synthase B [Bifidobacterium ruminantium]